MHTNTDRDLRFISDFLDNPILQEHYWLTKYFKTSIRYNFLIYFLTFRNSFHFREHTGFFCSIRYVKRMKKQFLLLERNHSEAKSKLDFEMVALIETGKFKLH